MSLSPVHPSLYQINTRVWMTRLSALLSRPATLDDIPDSELDRLAERGFDWVWLLSVWQSGPAAQLVSRRHEGWRKEFQETLVDLCDEDIAGSGFAIQEYSVHLDLGGATSLARLRRRMQERGLKLMLDFVPNHMAPDHAWVDEHPDFFVQRNDRDLGLEPQNCCRIETKNGAQIFACGRDPYFDGWPDTLQLNYGNTDLQSAMISELERIADQCDGLRCDMAMLILPDVFQRTWDIRVDSFWPKAIGSVREKHPHFLFMAEVYWDLEWTMLEQGFDYAYDKRLYDRLREGQARPVREHLRADLSYQSKLARFLENHDESRAAASFSPEVHEAAAVITFLSPGLRFFHEGQFEGCRKRISPHLVRRPEEPIDDRLANFYEKLLAVLHQPVMRNGHWQLLECFPAWEGNWTSDCFIAWSWQLEGDQRRLIVVNYAGNQSQCYVRIPFSLPGGRMVEFADELGSTHYQLNGDELVSGGLYLDLPAMAFHVFAVSTQ